MNNEKNWNEALEKEALTHQAGMDEMDGVIGEKTPGIIAYHKFHAGARWGRNYNFRLLLELFNHTKAIREACKLNPIPDKQNAIVGVNKMNLLVETIKAFDGWLIANKEKFQ